MTLFGADISNFQTGISVEQIAAEGFSWIESKVSEGNYYCDPTWQPNRDAAAAIELPCIGYHYAVASCSVSSQVACFQNNGGGAAVMIDFEDNSGDIGDFWALVNAFNAAGIYVAATYLPRWYWSRIGSPDLSQVPGLISSAYPTVASGYASAIYESVGGDCGSGWTPYGGATPIAWQYSDRAQVAGFSVDVNAFRGSKSELVAWLTGTSQGALMALTDDQQTDLYEKVQQLWAQLLGPQGHGWPQLGTNAAGQTLTPVDAVASLETQVAALSVAVAKIAAKVGA